MLVSCLDAPRPSPDLAFKTAMLGTCWAAVCCRRGRPAVRPICSETTVRESHPVGDRHFGILSGLDARATTLSLLTAL